jgi:hypothetical protein
MPRLLWEDIVAEPPEELAHTVKKYFWDKVSSAVFIDLSNYTRIE